MAWHLSGSDIAGQHSRGENYVNKRSAVVFRENEFRTPSPLLPSWHQSQPFSTVAMDEDSNDDCYFHSSDNIGCSYLQQPDTKSVSYRSDCDSLSGSQISAFDASDNCHLRCKSTELVDNCGSRFVRADRTVDERRGTASGMFNTRRLVIGRSSKSTLCTSICALIFYCPFFCWLLDLWCVNV